MASICSDGSVPVWYLLLTFVISLWLWDCNSSQHKKTEKRQEDRRKRKERKGQNRKKPEANEGVGVTMQGRRQQERVKKNLENEAEMRPQM